MVIIPNERKKYIVMGVGKSATGGTRIKRGTGGTLAQSSTEK